MGESRYLATIGVIAVALVALAGCRETTPANQQSTHALVQSQNGPTLNGVLPTVVDLPKSAPNPLAVRPNFDDFSWRSFVALAWPVSATRGIPLNPGDPQTLLSAGGNYNAVWTSLREDYELYTGA